MKKIVKNGFEEYKDHRGDFETCPGCGYKTEYETWVKTAHTLCLTPRFIKTNSVTVISKCPKCESDSWVHEPMDCFSQYSTRWPENWKKSVKKHADNMKLLALREWGESLCWSCKLLESGKIEYSTHRCCNNGWGPARKECEQYKKVK